ncbi:MAG: hypothetical protein M1837_000921 [Sclerophora amabilis]|nr:MAG: hypothetical protein M1837_000921 [Sclerophora amabilis]
MSGDLKHPSKAIPKGTLSGLALTFFAYTVVILAMAATITRASLYRNVNVIQDTNISAVLVLLGEFSTSFFSSLMGVIGSAKLLQALARDNLIPGFSIFGQGTKKGDEPTYGILITHIAAQLTMLLNINHIASFVTMTYLMTFLVTNLACFLLKISSAPNFRPSFHYFNWETALAGTLISGVLMFFVDGAYATGCVGILVVIFLIIHYTTPPKSWGDVSQSLIYHQVRKYLLRLRQEHVKFWRPQILLFINDPRRQYKLIQFCNSMKKGALYILGHVIVTPDFASSVPEARRQQAAWTKYIDFSKVKAFVNIAISPAVEWGTRNIVLSAGLGGMRPNIAVLAFYNLDEYRKRQPLVDVPEPQSTGENHSDNNRNQEPTSARNLSGTQNADQANGDDFTGNALPTDTCRTESAMSVQSYVTILEDLLLSLQINVALAKGFQNLEFPQPDGENSKKYIDLWPIQMSAEIGTENNDKGNVLTTNFDTYTLILQLGCILDTVPAWKKKYSLRVGVFVEYESDVEEERKRVKTLLSNLRIQAEVLVYWLASGDLKTYQIIVNGADSGNDVKSEHNVDEVLREEEWWLEIQKLRGKRGSPDTYDDLAAMEGFFSQGSNWPGSSFLQGPRTEQEERLQGLKRLINRTKRRPTLGGLTRLGVNLGMRTHRLSEDLVKSHDAPLSASENEDSESSEGSDDGRFHDEEDLSSRRRTSAATENDLDLSDHDKTESSGLAKSLHPSKVIRRRSYGDSISGPSSATRSGARENAQDALKAASKAPAAPSVDVSDKSDTAPINTSSSEAPRPSGSSKPASRPTTVRQSSMAKFSSKPVPMTTVATEDGPGPSIMFTDTPSPPAPHPGQSHRRSIYDSHQASPRRSTSGTAASGFPSSQSVPLTFNDLPCRAQHLILNELIQHQSARDTAVVFTTLPSPVQGTCRSEADSLRYLSDLEVLCQGLPPVLLVHSNSLTVTMNL